MKINIIGGGPAGLYFALLMKRQQAAHEVTVWERNAPDDTFGWGVVFSDKTLAYLRDADEPTYQAITRAFATWDNVDVVHRGRRVTIRGNKFSGIARIKLLNILQARCAELGVDLRFRMEANEPERLAAECDEQTWTGHRFSEYTDEETRDYLADVFIVDLAGHSLLSNNSKWIKFLLVKNHHWHHDNIVLLGDALHTAHFSIGSGTKLALE